MTAASLMITGKTSLFVEGELVSPVRYALDMIRRDHQTVFGEELRVTKNSAEAGIILRSAVDKDRLSNRPEAFGFRFEGGSGLAKPVLHIIGRDELGLVYGLLHYSREVLGVDPFWFWADLPPSRRSAVEVPVVNWDAPQPKVRFRGWFVNDEVCLIGWKKAYPPSREVWTPVFEALLRCGGNMVIPGTDLPRTGIHWELASEMGLWITHHHAEPLGAEMFLRAYPGFQASYKQHPQMYQTLWKEAIEKQKDQKVVWVLSFRGQGDAPFWTMDPEFDTSEKRGRLISEVVRLQYDMVRNEVESPVCCVALYGEIAELYKAGFVDVPEDVIKVWADNGYGRMVSRRNGNESLRVPSLPEKGDPGKNGIYYHVTFHDLQASNHLTMFAGGAELLYKEVAGAFEAGADEYMLVNCGNIRPHLYQLDLMAQMWMEGAGEEVAGGGGVSATVDRHRGGYLERLYSSHHDEIADIYRKYEELTLKYGPHEDDRAGEEFYHHPARRIIGHWMTGKGEQPLETLYWVAGERPFPEQVGWFTLCMAEKLEPWRGLKRDGEALWTRLQDKGDRTRLRDQVLLHIDLHLTGITGFHYLCLAYEAAMKGDYPLAFVRASQSMWAFEEGLEALGRSEHSRWERFYRAADWLTNIRSTVQNLDTLRRWLRMFGDSPHFFLWYKEYLMPETEKYIYLENTHRNPLSDDDLAVRLKERFGIKD